MDNSQDTQTRKSIHLMPGFKPCGLCVMDGDNFIACSRELSTFNPRSKDFGDKEGLRQAHLS